MATTIINPATNNNAFDGNGVSLLVGGIVLIVSVLLFFVFTMPLIRGFSGNGGVQVTVPKNIDINVKQSK